jgi:deoxyhypusine synthase
MTVGELTLELQRAGVIGAGRVGKAVDLVADIFSDPDFTSFMTLSGPLVPSGMRLIFHDLIRDGYIDAIVTNGANIIHDLVEAIGRQHLVGTQSIDDDELLKQGFNRIYDIFIESYSFIELEKFVTNILDTIPESQRTNFAYHEFLRELGLRLDDKESILNIAAVKDIPIFCPGFLDSMLGIPLWMYSKQKSLSFDPLKDFDLMASMVFDAKKSGAIILGGGVPKHHTQYIHTLRDGLDSAIQISTARVEDGSLSGAPLRESISWGKLKNESLEQNTSTIFGDVTILFPLIVSAALEKIIR